MFYGGCKILCLSSRKDRVKLQIIFNRSELESSAIEGDSPVHEKDYYFSAKFLSTTGPVKSRGNLGRL